MISKSILAVSALAGLALAEPLATPAAQLNERAIDPAFVGFISQSGSYDNARTCDYPQTVSTSAGYFQCCGDSKPCNFFTACSNNMLIAASATVSCDVDPGLACNTGLVYPTPGASNAASYLACWQTTLGSNPFTIVQNIGTSKLTPIIATAPSTGSSSSTAAATATGGSSTGSGSTSAGQTSTPAVTTGATTSSGSPFSPASSSSSSSSSSKGVAAGVHVGLESGLVGMIAYALQMLL